MIRVLLSILIPLGLACFVWGFFIEPGTLRDEQHSIALENWPEGCNGLRIAVLADLHVGSPHNHLDNLQRIVARTQEARPDLILLAGDYVIHGVVGGDFVAPETVAPVLAGLSAPLGVWAVLGNHDWWLDAARVQAAIEAAGIRFLEDAAVRVGSTGCSFWLAGISDFWEGPHDVDKALADIDDPGPIVAFTHNPDVFPEIPGRVDLTIAGHTHGGQVYLPLVGRPVVPSRYGERFAIGHIVEEGRHLFVSAGVGTSILPVRFLVPPEVVVLSIHSAN